MRTILFSVTAQALTPATPQYAGVQGERRATQVVFSLAPELLDAAYVYYLEYVDGLRQYDITPLLTPVNGQITYALPDGWTQNGGMGAIRLVIVRPGTGGTGTGGTGAAGITSDADQIVFSGDARIYFLGRDLDITQPVQTGLSELLLEVQSSAKQVDELVGELQTMV
ncbi:MAG: hypothetical protein FWF49_03410, partial [Oscillospiraceae bacterium]|nr:hypothetical protein [Oscillospiraceae bacterium]